MGVVAIIPARGGSKGIPGKNIKLIAGKPLIAHTIEQSIRSKLVDRTVVTTDCDEIAKVSKSYGAEVVVRPAKISEDTSTSESAIIHAINELRRVGSCPDVVVFLQCTSPYRKDGDIDAALNKYFESGCDSLLSVVKDHRFLWRPDDSSGFSSINYDYKSRQRRQEFSEQYTENGSLYIFRADGVCDCNNRLHGYISVFEMSKESLYEIDDEVDWLVVDSIMAKRT